MENICKKCNKDHTKKNEGPLTVCELRVYFSIGAPSSHKDFNGTTPYGFGTGNRFQFPGAK